MPGASYGGALGSRWPARCCTAGGNCVVRYEHARCNENIDPGPNWQPTDVREVRRLSKVAAATGDRAARAAVGRARAGQGGGAPPGRRRARWPRPCVARPWIGSQGNVLPGQKGHNGVGWGPQRMRPPRGASRRGGPARAALLCRGGAVGRPASGGVCSKGVARATDTTGSGARGRRAALAAAGRRPRASARQHPSSVRGPGARADGCARGCGASSRARAMLRRCVNT